MQCNLWPTFSDEETRLEGIRLQAIIGDVNNVEIERRIPWWGWHISTKHQRWLRWDLYIRFQAECCCKLFRHLGT